MPLMIETISDFRRAMRHGPFAWPGGYPCYFLCADGEALSFEAAKENRRAVLEALRDRTPYDAQWRVVALDVNWEDTELYCAHTYKKIESAYGVEDEEIPQE